jgi:hypothetical protein
MPSNPNVKKVIIAVALIILVIAASSWMRSEDKPSPDEGLEVSFSEEDIDKLGVALENLEFEDLEGLTEDDTSIIGFSEEDLNNLEEALKGLEFEDLAGLQDN